MPRGLTVLAVIVAFAMVFAVGNVASAEEVHVPSDWPENLEIQEIDVQDDLGSVLVGVDTASPDYLYVQIMVEDGTDAREGENPVGSDQTGLNINPTDGADWGHPYDIIFQTGADPDAWHGDSSGEIDGWGTDWSINGEHQESLPDGLEVTTTYHEDGRREQVWLIPLDTINWLESVYRLLVGGATEIGDGASYLYPADLLWSDASTFVVLQVDRPDTVWVDDDYDSDTEGWGYDRFDSIQDGIDAVAEDGMVNVAAGTYEEDLTIDKAITLEGANAGVSAGRYPGERGEESIIKGTLCILGGSVVDGFRIENEPEGEFAHANHGISIGDAALRNSIVVRDGDDRKGIGVKAANVRDATPKVIENTVEGYSYGIVGEWERPELMKVEANQLKDNFMGAYFDSSMTEGNTITDNDFEENAIGLMLANADNNVSGNRFENNATGVRLWETADDTNTFTSNDFRHNPVQFRDDSATLNLDGVEEDSIINSNDFDEAIFIYGSPLKVPAIYGSIEAALEDAEDGDTIVVEVEGEATFDPDAVILGDTEPFTLSVDLGDLGKNFTAYEVKVEYDPDHFSADSDWIEFVAEGDTEISIDDDAGLLTAAATKHGGESFGGDTGHLVDIDFQSAGDVFDTFSLDSVTVELVWNDTKNAIELVPPSVAYEKGNVVTGEAEMERERDDYARDIVVDLKNVTDEPFGADRTVTIEDELLGDDFEFVDVFPGDAWEVHVNADGFLRAVMKDVEVDWTLNEVTDVELFTLLAGDINDDGHINVIDLWLIAQKYNQEGEFTEDLTGDGKVGLLDLRMAARNLGASVEVLFYND